jgi:hypothetical protein
VVDPMGNQLASVFIVSDSPVYSTLITSYEVCNFSSRTAFLVPGHDQQVQVDTEGHCNNQRQRDKGKSHARPYRKLRQTRFYGLCFAFFMQNTVYHSVFIPNQPLGIHTRNAVIVQFRQDISNH